MQDIIEAVKLLPDRGFMANCFASLRAELRSLIRPKRPRHRASIPPRTWHRGRIRRAA